jgi:hypothetical protein
VREPREGCPDAALHALFRVGILQIAPRATTLDLWRRLEGDGKWDSDYRASMLDRATDKLVRDF